jgi:hypothetical protein
MKIALSSVRSIPLILSAVLMLPLSAHAGGLTPFGLQAVPTELAILRSAEASDYASFGSAVAISGDTAVVGEVEKNTVYIFVRSGSAWVEQARLSGVGSSHFGGAVALEGNTLVVGAEWEAPRGAAYVFERSGTDWIEKARLESTGSPSIYWGRRFGQAVAISGTTIVVGDPGESVSSGAAYVFERTTVDWPDPWSAPPFRVTAGWEFEQIYAAFGAAVAISGDRIVIGAPTEDLDPFTDTPLILGGAVYVFERTGGEWSPIAFRLRAGDAMEGAMFGTSVAACEDVIAVGAPGHDVDGDESDSGQAYLFSRLSVEPFWLDAARFTGGKGGAFGQSVSIGERTLAVGAPYFSVASPFVPTAGGVFLYTNANATWSYPFDLSSTVLKASNRQPDDAFGWSVATDGQRVLVGATGEDGDLDSYLDSGAAYLFGEASGGMGAVVYFSMGGRVRDGWYDVKGKSVIPLRFQILDSNSQPVGDVAAIGSLTARRIDCATQDPLPDMPAVNLIADLKYDPEAGQFVLNWRAPEESIETCWKITLAAGDDEFSLLIRVAPAIKGKK